LYPEGEHPGKSGAADGQIVQNVHNLKKRLYCTVHSQEYLHGQDNYTAESLASIHNNSADNEPHNVSTVGNIGGDHAINNNNHDVALVNKVGDTEIIHDSCGTGPDIHVDNQSGVGAVVGDIDNGSPSLGLDDGFEIGRHNNIEPCEFAAVGNVGGGHSINNNHFDVAVMNNFGKNEIMHNTCSTGHDINIGDHIGVVDDVASLNSDLRDVAILQQQCTSLQQPEIVGNTNINNENQEQGGDGSVDNATRQARKKPDTGC
jgi:hypothetical protein